MTNALEWVHAPENSTELRFGCVILPRSSSLLPYNVDNEYGGGGLFYSAGASRKGGKHDIRCWVRRWPSAVRARSTCNLQIIYCSGAFLNVKRDLIFNSCSTFVFYLFFTFFSRNHANSCPSRIVSVSLLFLTLLSIKVHQTCSNSLALT